MLLVKITDAVCSHTTTRSIIESYLQRRVLNSKHGIIWRTKRMYEALACKVESVLKLCEYT